MVDIHVIEENSRDAKTAIQMQNDILLYVVDVFRCDIPAVGDILEDKLLQFAMLPVLVGSLLRPKETGPGSSPTHDLTSGRDPVASTEDYRLSANVSAYLLFDVLTTENLPDRISSAVAASMLRQDTPEQVLRALVGPSPHTPRHYTQLQA